MDAEHNLVKVGRLSRPHGLLGEIKVYEQEGSGAWRAAFELFVGPDAKSLQSFEVVGIRGSGRFAIIRLKGVESREAAEALKGQAFWVPRDCLPEPEEGDYYVDDLLGLQVEDEQGKRLGRLKSIFDNGAHEVYEVAGPNGSILLPVTPGVVLEVDLDGGRMVVAPPVGLPGIQG